MTDFLKKLRGEKRILDLQASYSQGIRNIFLISAVIILSGNLIDILQFSKENRPLFLLNLINVALIVLALIAYFYRKGTFKADFTVVIYSIFFNMIIGKFFTTFEVSDPIRVSFYLRDSLFVIFLLTMASFALNKIHSFIIGGIYIVFSLIFSLTVKNGFLNESIFLILFVISAYIGLTYYLVSILEKALSNLHEKNRMIETQNEFLNETNTILEERQQTIEEQAQAIESQAHRLQFQSEELLEKNKELSNLNASKDMFFSIIAHDLKNPFNLVMGYSELLLKKYKELPEEKKMSYVGSIYTTTLKIYYLFENLLSWAMSQTNRLSVKPERISLKELIKEVVELYTGVLKDKSIRFEVDHNGSYFCFADRHMISLVLRNIMSNAIKFTPSKGTIQVSFKDSEKFVDCIVTDTGVGMDEKVIPEIFDLDKHHLSAGTDGEKGTGLGLKLCKLFVEKNNGQIRVTSKLNQGTSFIISLPVN